MNSLRTTTLLLFGIFLIVTSLVAAVIASAPTAVPTNSGITVRWVTEDETGVSKFDILRKDAQGNFIEIKTIAPQGSGRVYEYTDQSVFKAEDRVFVYKIRATLGGGYQDSAPVTVSYGLSSTAKRTWGSIKAMFR